MLHRYDSGRLANSKAMNEDLTEFKTEELHTCTIDPASIAWRDRKQGCAPFLLVPLTCNFYGASQSL
jgi:hypothetical protein